MIQNLPNEIIIKILDNLPPTTLHNIASVNRQWSHIARTLGICQLDFAQFDVESFYDRQEMVDYIEGEIPTDEDGERIQHLLILSHDLLPNNVFHFIQQLCPNVISFDYDQNMLFDINTTAITTGTQQHFQHRYYSNEWVNSIAHLPACHRFQRSWLVDADFCQRLQTLYILHGYDPLLFKYAKHRYYGLRLPSLPHLDTLTLHSSQKFSEKPINHIHRRCDYLTTLTLRNTSLACVFHRKPNSRYSVLSVAAPRLTDLTLENVVFLHHHAFLFFPKKYPNIQTLTLSTTFQNYAHHHQLSDKQRYPHSIHFYIYHMIIGFRYLKKLTIYLHSFGTKNSILNQSLHNDIQDHFRRTSSKRIKFDLTCS